MFELATLLLVACRLVASDGAVLQHYGVAAPQKSSQEVMREGLTDRFFSLLDQSPPLDEGRIQYLERQKSKLQQAVKHFDQQENNGWFLDRQLKEDEARQYAMQQHKLNSYNQAKIIDAVVSIHNTPLLHLSNVKSADLHIPLASPTKTPCEESADKTAKLLSQLLGIKNLDSYVFDKKPEPTDVDEAPENLPPSTENVTNDENVEENAINDENAEENNINGENLEGENITEENATPEQEELPEEEGSEDNEIPENEDEVIDSEESTPHKELQDYPEHLDDDEESDTTTDDESAGNEVSSGEKGVESDENNVSSGESSSSQSASSEESQEKGSEKEKPEECSGENCKDSQSVGTEESASQGEDCSDETKKQSEENSPSSEDVSCAEEVSCQEESKEQSEESEESNEEEGDDNETSEELDESEENDVESDETGEEKDNNEVSDEQNQTSEETSDEKNETTEKGDEESEDDSEEASEPNEDQENCSGDASKDCPSSEESDCKNSSEECEETSVGADQETMDEMAKSEEKTSESDESEDKTPESDESEDKTPDSHESKEKTPESYESKQKTPESHESGEITPESHESDSKSSEECEECDGDCEESQETDEEKEKPTSDDLKVSPEEAAVAGEEKSQEKASEDVEAGTESPQTEAPLLTETPADSVDNPPTHYDYDDYIQEEQSKCGCKGPEVAEYDIAEFQPLPSPASPCESTIQKFLMKLRPVHIGRLPGRPAQMGTRRADDSLSPLAPNFLANLMQNAKVKSPQDIATPQTPTTPPPPVPPPSDRRSLGMRYLNDQYLVPSYGIPTYSQYGPVRNHYGGYQEEPYRHVQFANQPIMPYRQYGGGEFYRY